MPRLKKKLKMGHSDNFKTGNFFCLLRTPFPMCHLVTLARTFPNSVTYYLNGPKDEPKFTSKMWLNTVDVNIFDVKFVFDVNIFDVPVFDITVVDINCFSLKWHKRNAFADDILSSKTANIFCLWKKFVFT